MKKSNAYKKIMYLLKTQLHLTFDLTCFQVDTLFFITSILFFIHFSTTVHTFQSLV